MVHEKNNHDVSHQTKTQIIVAVTLGAGQFYPDKSTLVCCIKLLTSLSTLYDLAAHNSPASLNTLWPTIPHSELTIITSFGR